MNNLCICIPTLSSEEKINPLIDTIKRTCSLPYRLIHTAGSKLSASANRNTCLAQSHSGDIILMMDDDVNLDALTFGWDLKMAGLLAVDVDLVMSPYIANPARPNSRLAREQETPRCRIVPHLATAFIAFTHRDIFFDERFRGSGYEDYFFCKTMKYSFPKTHFVENANFVVYHNGEKKYRQANLEYNSDLYIKLSEEIDNGTYSIYCPSAQRKIEAV